MRSKISPSHGVSLLGRRSAKAPSHYELLLITLEVLREDNRAVVRAASAASKAADFLLAFLPPAIDSLVEGNEEARDASARRFSGPSSVGAARQRVRGAPVCL